MSGPHTTVHIIGWPHVNSTAMWQKEKSNKIEWVMKMEPQQVAVNKATIYKSLMLQREADYMETVDGCKSNWGEMQMKPA